MVIEKSRMELIDKKLLEIRKKSEVLLQPAPNDETYKAMLEKDFLIRYNYESTAIEGNVLTQIEHEGILNRDQCPCTERMRSIYEAINHADAFECVYTNAIKQKPLTEEILLSLHQTLMNHLLEGGKYRMCNITVHGATHKFPEYTEIPMLMEKFFMDLDAKSKCVNVSKFELAAWAHAELVNIHPFQDGNGRMARLVMNYMLLLCGCLPISIPIERKEEYFKILDDYYEERNTCQMLELVIQQEEIELDRVIKIMEPVAYPLLLDYDALQKRYPKSEDYFRELRTIMDRYQEEVRKRRGF